MGRPNRFSVKQQLEDVANEVGMLTKNWLSLSISRTNGMTCKSVTLFKA